MTKNNTNEFEKERKFRIRKTDHSKPPEQERNHPAHQPYKRENTNWTRNPTIDGLGEDFSDED